MSRAGLSLRKLRKTACRNRPSRVHSPNDTSATKVGFTQCGLASISTDAVNGLVRRAMASSAFLIASSDASSKPAPTLPACTSWPYTSRSPSSNAPKPCRAAWRFGIPADHERLAQTALQLDPLR